MSHRIPDDETRFRNRLCAIRIEEQLISRQLQRLADGEVGPPAAIRAIPSLIPAWQALHGADLKARIDALKYEAAMLRLSYPDGGVP